MHPTVCSCTPSRAPSNLRFEKGALLIARHHLVR
jgi:hypothetical protein